MTGRRASVGQQVTQCGLLSSAHSGILALACNDNQSECLPLFEYCGINAPAEVKGYDRLGFSVAHWTDIDRRHCFGEYSYQLHLPINLDGLDNVVRLVPLRRYPALSNHFPSLVRRDEALSKLAVKLSHRRKLYLGDVVQISEAELLALLNGNKRALERLRRHLAEYSLEFGMRAPRWKSPGGLLSPFW